jgi:hypothetical protein
MLGSPAAPVLVLAVAPPSPSLAFTVFLPHRFEDVEWRVAATGNEGAGGRVFRFGRQGLAAVSDANRFFFQPFDRARGRAGACEQKRASESNPRGSLPETNHPTISTVRRPIYQETRRYA